MSNYKATEFRWGNEFSLTRAHSGSDKSYLGGHSGNTFDYPGDGSFLDYSEMVTPIPLNDPWVGQLTKLQGTPLVRVPRYFHYIFQTGGGTATIGTDAPLSGGEFGFPSQNEISHIVLSNSGPGEAYTSPYTGFGGVLCETAPDTTWKWSVKIQNQSQNFDAGTFDLWIFALDEAGQLVYNQPGGGGTSRCSGSDGGPSSIPTTNNGYNLRGTIDEGLDIVEYTGFAKFNNDSRTRYLSMRFDLNDQFASVVVGQIRLTPCDMVLGDEPLILTSPRMFKPRRDISLTPPGNRHEYIRLALDGESYSSNDDVPDIMEIRGWRGFKWGPEFGGDNLSNTNDTGGSNVDYPTGQQGFLTAYSDWLLWYGTTPSSNTGPANGIPSLPEFANDPERQHFGYKRSNEPQGSVYDHNYLYAETSSTGKNKRFALRFPEIDFTSTTQDETLSFYFHAYGIGIGQLKLYYGYDPNDFFIPGDLSSTGTTPSSDLIFSELTALPTYQYYDANGSHQNDSIGLAGSLGIDGQQHSNPSQNWYRCEINLSELRGQTGVYLVLLYESINDYRGDFAISNIIVSGISA